MNDKKNVYFCKLSVDDAEKEPSEISMAKGCVFSQTRIDHSLWFPRAQCGKFLLFLYSINIEKNVYLSMSSKPEGTIVSPRFCFAEKEKWIGRWIGNCFEWISSIFKITLRQQTPWWRLLVGDNIEGGLVFFLPSVIFCLCPDFSTFSDVSIHLDDYWQSSGSKRSPYIALVVSVEIIGHRISDSWLNCPLFSELVEKGIARSPNGRPNSQICANVIGDMEQKAELGIKESKHRVNLTYTRKLVHQMQSSSQVGLEFVDNNLIKCGFVGPCMYTPGQTHMSHESFVRDDAKLR